MAKPRSSAARLKELPPPPPVVEREVTFTTKDGRTIRFKRRARKVNRA